MTQEAKILYGILVLQKKEKFRKYSAEEIRAIANELGKSLEDFITEMINTLVHMYFRSSAFGTSLPAKRLEKIFELEKEDVIQPYNITDLLEVEKELGLRDRELLAIMARQVVNLYEKTVKLDGIIEYQEQEIECLANKVKYIYFKQNEGKMPSKKVTQAEFLQNGVIGSLNKREDVTYDRIKQLEDLGYTDEQIADKLKTSRSTIYRRRDEWKKKHNPTDIDTEYKKQKGFGW